jgi:hypothetical protein
MLQQQKCDEAMPLMFALLTDMPGFSSGSTDMGVQRYFLSMFWTTMTDSFTREVKTKMCFHRHARIYY